MKSTSGRISSWVSMAGARFRVGPGAKFEAIVDWLYSIRLKLETRIGCRVLILGENGEQLTIKVVARVKTEVPGLVRACCHTRSRVSVYGMVCGSCDWFHRIYRSSFLHTVEEAAAVNLLAPGQAYNVSASAITTPSA